MTETKRQWFVRALIGGLTGAALLLALVWVLDAMPWMSHIWQFRNPFSVWGEWLIDGYGWPSSPLPNLILWFLAGAEAGVATLPFADSGRELVVRSLVHYAATAATVSAWVVLNFGWRGTLPTFLIPLTLVYILVWLGRWVGWYAEVAAIREKLGLAPGPSPLHWKESLPYVGFAFLLCLILPTVLRLLDDPTPVLSVLYGLLLLPAGGFMSGLSLGRRHGFCPLYPVSCVLFTLIFILTAKLYTNMADGALIPIALISVLAGNLAGAARRRMKKGAGAP